MQIQTYKNKLVDFIKRLGDARFAGQVVFVVIVLLISWSGIKTIQTNYTLQKKVSALKQQNNVQQLENNNLQLQNGYLGTNQYLELTARQNFGLAAPGEKELVVPENVAMAYTSNAAMPPAVPPASAHQPTYQRHFESWVDFFLHRSNTN
jgi:cell division protein FtsL